MEDEEREQPETEGNEGEERLTPDSDEAKVAESEEEAEDDATKRIDEAFE
jgi:hypothetical protein